MTDIWDAATASISGDAAIRNNGLQLYSGTRGTGWVTSVSRTARDVVANGYYFEVTVVDNIMQPDFVGVGLDGPGDFAGGGAQNLTLFNTGKVYNGSTVVATLTLPAGGLNGVVGIAAKGGKVWWRIDGGVWNPGIAGADPATGAGGVPLVEIPTYNYIFGAAFSPTTPIDVWATEDINTGSAFAFTPPAGFQAWGIGFAPGVPINPGPPSVSAGSPNPPAPNPIGVLRHERGLTTHYPD